MTSIRTGTLLAAAILAACATVPKPEGGTSAAYAGAVSSISLPDAPPEGVSMDYIAYDRAHHRVWVPAGNTAAVDVLDVINGQIKKIGGFVTAEIERDGKKRRVGPSSAAVGEGTVYVGNRGDSTVCAFNAESLEKGPCVKLESSPDGPLYVASEKELWVTTPSDKSITIIDTSAPGSLTVKTKIVFDGEPEGFAIDDKRGIFYTNLEDKDQTLAIDVRSRKTNSTWATGCGKDGPRGLVIDPALNFLIVACTDRVKLLDAGHDGKQLSELDTGAGVDNLDYLQSRRELYVAARKAAKLTIAGVDAQGRFNSPNVVSLPPGARNPVVTDEGVTYLPDSAGGKLVVVQARSR